MNIQPIPISALNIAPLREGQTPKDAIESMVELAKQLERLGYTRYWLAEHHNMPSVMSTATSILMQQVLMNTKRILVGAGGIMLPNHSPLVVAEQFGTLATLFPQRVDLGLGRAPGTDALTAAALRRAKNGSGDSFPSDIQEVASYFEEEALQGQVKAIPAVGTHVPMYILGSSVNSAMIAAQLGLPYAFAAHFTATYLKDAVELYRKHFKPSKYLDKPYVITALNIIAADTVEDANRQFSSIFQMAFDLFQNKFSPLKPPIENLNEICPEEYQQIIKANTGITLIGDKLEITKQLTEFQHYYAPDEIMVVTYIYDFDKQVRSYEIVKEIMNELM